MAFSPRILLTLVALISVASGCSEPTQPTPPAPVIPVNTPPTVSAGWDAWVPLPSSSAVLTGRAADKESHLESFSWKKVSGPASYSIEGPNSPQTKVANLEEGTYQFELTVTDKGGLTGKDTVAIFAYEPRTPGANELIFKNLQGRCDRCDLFWGESVSYVIENLHAYLPAGTALKVFLKVAGSTNWVEVPSTGNENYVYRINGNRVELEVDTDYLPDPYRPVDVKITF